MKKIREGSIADKSIKALNWMDNSKIGGALGVMLVAVVFCGLAVYGLQCTHPFL